MDSSTLALILTTLFGLGSAAFVYLINQVNELKKQNHILQEKVDLFESLLFNAVIGLKSRKADDRIRIANEILAILNPEKK